MARRRLDRTELDALSERVIGAAIKIHRQLGPGLLESAYEACLQFELTRQGLFVERQKPQPVPYDGLLIDVGYRIDLLVERELLVELKAVGELAAIHQCQVLTYLRLSDLRLGLLLNFNVVRLKEGIRRYINGSFPTEANSAASLRPSQAATASVPETGTNPPT